MRRAAVVAPFGTARPRAAVVVCAQAQTERLRLNNLSPPKGSRRDEKRKGRGYAAGQVCALLQLQLPKPQGAIQLLEMASAWCCQTFAYKHRCVSLLSGCLLLAHC